MARDVRRAKTESLTLRLDPKTRFMLDFVSRVRGQPLTTVVERALAEHADGITVEDFGRQDGVHFSSWRDFWSVHDGVRALTMARYPQLFPTFEDEKRLAFCREHWPFFFATPDGEKFLTAYIDVLWPRIDEFVSIHDNEKSTDYFAAGRAMQAALQAAKFKAPEWNRDNVENPF
jgi:hypothetical protein